MLSAGVAAAQAGCLEAPGDLTRPYARLPPEVTPGNPRYFATSMTLDGLATGLVVESHEGRPTKIEGNPEHPTSLGATLAQHQASVLDLYDPSRLKAVTDRGKPSSWHHLLEALTKTPGPLWVVTPSSSSPLQRWLLERLKERNDDVHSVVLPTRWAHAYQGAQLALGRPVETQLDLTQAKIIVSLDAELFSTAPMALRWAHDYTERRRSGGLDDLPRLYVFEAMLSPTGMLADHRLAVRTGDVLSICVALWRELQRRGLSLPALPSGVSIAAPKQKDSHARAAILSALADDLLTHRRRSVVAVGPAQPPVCHALAHVLNQALGNLQTTVFHTEALLAQEPEAASLADLSVAVQAKQVQKLLILDCNPVYAAPPGLALERVIRAVPVSAHVDLHRNETSRVCRFHGPLSHYLESWGDARAGEGTLSLVQPLIRPLYDSRSSAEVLAALAGEQDPSGHGQLRGSFRRLTRSGDDFEHAFRASLAQGYLAGSESPRLNLTPALTGGAVEALDRALALAHQRRDALEISLRTSPTIYDERFANNAWLQELPHPRTKLTWDNAAMMSPALADSLGVDEARVLRIEKAGRHIELPVVIVPEHAPQSISIELGYGRNAPEEPIAHAVGDNATRLTDAWLERMVYDVEVRPTDKRAELARTQQNFLEDDRELAISLSLRQFKKDPGVLKRLREDQPSTLPRTRSSEGPQWAMTIDMSVCSGCSACVIACQSENNIPAVGKHQVRLGREMQWLRIDSYRQTDTRHGPGVTNQPMMCQHCEHAPCEYVCPVFATEHSPDGLNEMVYNRCIGTRFCQANCPYKVRRFNWLHYTHRWDGMHSLQRNPQVTVRDRGVMEKCTYCVQRIRRAEHQARMEQRRIREGEVRTACQQACPTQAIAFFALQHEDLVPAKAWDSELAYGVLNHLGTRPRTRYLAKIRNVNDALEEDA